MAKENMVEKRENKTLTPRSYIQYCRSLEIQLIFQFIFEWFPFTKRPFKTGKDNRNSSLGLRMGDRDRLIKVTV